MRKGVVLITDFSGFTEFLFSTQIYTGEYIVRELLLTIIKANNGYFYISEIEGDAVLFYKLRKNPSYQDTVEVIKRMQIAFDEKISELSVNLDTKIEMSLKFIVHYGEFSNYSIKKFGKLYSKAIVETHQLLKNTFAEYSSYTFFSNPFLESVVDGVYSMSKVSKLVPGMGMIYYQDL